MNLSSRIKFYSIGVVFGLFLVFFLFGDRKFSCSYFPNERVLEECYNKPKEYSDLSKIQLKNLGLDSIFIQQKVFIASKIDFSKSSPRNKPCGSYITKYQKEDLIYKIAFLKCKDKIIISSVNKVSK